MPQFDGLGLTDAQQHLATVVFVIALGVLFAWSQWKGIREKVRPTVTKEYAFTGSLSDMQPVRELVAVATEVMESLKLIAELMREEAERKQRERDADEAAARRDEAAARRTRQPKPRQTPVSRGQS